MIEPTASSTNYRKFQTGNPVVRRLIDRFYARVEAAVEPLGAGTVLDAGCGEGETIARLFAGGEAEVSALDISPEAVEFTATRLPGVAVQVGSVYELPFEDDAFDLVLCLEVLEHLDRPDRALAELSRVAKRDIVVSTPDEPWFRLGSLARGNYVRSLGDHPEHINHWTPRSLGRLLAEQVEVVSLDRSLPWLVAHCRSRG